MKNKLNIGDAVPNGTVRDLALFADHVEYLVEQTDGTASWLHEDKLKPKSKTSNLE